MYGTSSLQHPCSSSLYVGITIGGSDSDLDLEAPLANSRITSRILYMHIRSALSGKGPCLSPKRVPVTAEATAGGGWEGRLPRQARVVVAGGIAAPRGGARPRRPRGACRRVRAHTPREAVWQCVRMLPGCCPYPHHPAVNRPPRPTQKHPAHRHRRSSRHRIPRRPPPA